MMSAGDEGIDRRSTARAAHVEHSARCAGSIAPAIDVSGRWDVRIEYAAGASTHVLHLRQKGNELDGTHQGDFVARDLTGTISGGDVRLRSNYGGGPAIRWCSGLPGKRHQARDVGRSRHGRISEREVDSEAG